MKVLDKGHHYQIDVLDAPTPLRRLAGTRLRFVKRIGAKFPGNVAPGYAGTTTQEVLRALIDRQRYVDGQRPDLANLRVIRDLRSALMELEMRAARERGDSLVVGLIAAMDESETAPTCPGCGHLLCERPECRNQRESK